MFKIIYFGKRGYYQKVIANLLFYLYKNTIDINVNFYDSSLLIYGWYNFTGYNFRVSRAQNFIVGFHIKILDFSCIKIVA